MDQLEADLDFILGDTASTKKDRRRPGRTRSQPSPKAGGSSGISSYASLARELESDSDEQQAGTKASQSKEAGDVNNSWDDDDDDLFAQLDRKPTSKGSAGTTSKPSAASSASARRPLSRSKSMGPIADSAAGTKTSTPRAALKKQMSESSGTAGIKPKKSRAKDPDDLLAMLDEDGGDGLGTGDGGIREGSTETDAADDFLASLGLGGKKASSSKSEPLAKTTMSKSVSFDSVSADAGKVVQTGADESGYTPSSRGPRRRGRLDRSVTFDDSTLLSQAERTPSRAGRLAHDTKDATDQPIISVTATAAQKDQGRVSTSPAPDLHETAKAADEISSQGGVGDGVEAKPEPNPGNNGESIAADDKQEPISNQDAPSRKRTVAEASSSSSQGLPWESSARASKAPSSVAAPAEALSATPKDVPASRTKTNDQGPGLPWDQPVSSTSRSASAAAPNNPPLSSDSSQLRYELQQALAAQARAESEARRLKERLNEAQEDARQQLEDEGQRHRRAMDSLEADHKRALLTASEAKDAEMERIRSSFLTEIAELKKSHREAMAARENELTAELEHQKRLRKEEVLSALDTKENAQALRSLISSLQSSAADVTSLRASISSEAQQTLQAREASLTQREEWIKSQEAELRARSKALDEERFALQETYARFEQTSRQQQVRHEERERHLTKLAARLEAQQMAAEEERLRQVDDFAQERRELQTMRAEIMKERAEMLAELQSQKRALAREVADFRNEKQQRAADERQRSQQALETAEQAEAALQEAARRRAELDERAARVRRHEARLAAAKRKMQQERDALEISRQEVQQLSQEINSWAQQLVEAQKHLAEQQAAAKQAQQEADQLSTALQEEQFRLDRLFAQLQERESKLAQGALSLAGRTSGTDGRGRSDEDDVNDDWKTAVGMLEELKASIMTQLHNEPQTPSLRSAAPLADLSNLGARASQKPSDEARTGTGQLPHSSAQDALAGVLAEVEAKLGQWQAEDADTAAV